MKLPSLKVEQQLQREGKQFVIGVDEVGRGPLAGPVVAVAAWLKPDFYAEELAQCKLIRDSKTLSEKQRREVFELTAKNKDHFLFCEGRVSEQIIDRVNIRAASLLAMRMAVEGLLEKIKQQQEDFSLEQAILLIDGDTLVPKIELEQVNFVKGDRDIFSIALASVLAKVIRDREMAEVYDQKFPEYRFKQHKGYGTRLHLEKLRLYGPCPIHRKSFAPVKRALKKLS